MTKKIKAGLPLIGILVFEGFLANEVVAPLDVFTKPDAAGQALFHVVLIAPEQRAYESEEGLRVLPDLTIADAPALQVLIVPSSLNHARQVQDPALIAFIRRQHRTADYLASHCAGAFLLGEAGVAAGKRVVTYCGGGAQLQQAYADLLVQDDAHTAVVRDGNLISSNGNLVSYLASLELLEQLTSPAQRQRVAEELLFHKLTQAPS